MIYAHTTDNDIRSLAEKQAEHLEAYQPENKTISDPICPKHGPYQFKKIGANSVCMTIYKCPKCGKEHTAEIDRIVAELTKERNQLILTNRYELAGIMPRNIKAELIASSPSDKEQIGLINAYQNVIDAMRDNTNINSMIVSGSVGRGKTYLSSALVKKLIDLNKRAKIIKVSKLIRLIKDTWNDKTTSEDDVIDHFSKLDLLIIDELGIQFDSNTEKLFLNEIIDNRYNNEKPTILISNLDIAGITEIVGNRAIDRLREGGGIARSLTGDSLRK